MADITFLSILGWTVALIFISILAYRAYQNHGPVAVIFLLPFAAAVDIITPPYGPDLETPLAFAIEPGVSGLVSQWNLSPAALQWLAVAGTVLLILGVIAALAAIWIAGGYWLPGVLVALLGTALIFMEFIIAHPLVVAYGLVYASAAAVVVLYVKFLGFSPKEFA